MSHCDNGACQARLYAGKATIAEMQHACQQQNYSLPGEVPCKARCLCIQAADSDYHDESIIAKRLNLEGVDSGESRAVRHEDVRHRNVGILH